MKLLAWTLLGLLVLWAVRSKKSAENRKQQAQTNQANQNAIAQTMVQCAYCGIYFPSSESISDAGNVFCSIEHKQLHVQKN